MTSTDAAARRSRAVRAASIVTADGPIRVSFGGIGGRTAWIDGRGRTLGSAVDLPAGTHVIDLR